MERAFLLIVELILIILYLFLILFHIVILPLNIILGIICVLFLPGYNLLNILKPRFNLIEKLGYMTIISLAISNITMFFYYIFLYDVATTPDKPGFLFNAILLIEIIQIINIILILINTIYFYIETKKVREFEIKFEIRKKYNNIKKKIRSINFKYLREEINFSFLIVSMGFFLSLILLCVSTLYSNVPDNQFLTNYNDYQSNFTFFYRVPFIFYIFLVFSILCLTCIVFFSKNIYFILICISLFIYCLWILPYLQIRNYFASDSHLLYIIYNNYLNHGIRSIPNYGFVIKLKGYGIYTSYRYSTSLFTSILLTSATGTHINFVLWFLYPLIFVFIPFFFYSVFQKFSNTEGNDNLTLIVLTFLAIITPQIIKSARIATTGVIGTVIFLMLVIEFFDLMHQKEIKIKIMNIITILFLYFFLCLSHFEESIYFLIILALYNIYYLFFKIKTFKSETGPNHLNFFLPKIQKKYVKMNLIMIGSLLCILSLIFYLTEEFFGYINFYFKTVLGQDYEHNIIYILYKNSKIEFQPILRGNYLISTLVILIIISGTLLYIIACFVIFLKYYGFFFKIFSYIHKSFLKKIHNFIKKLISTKIFQLLIFPLFFSIILLLNFLYFEFLEERGLILIFVLILSYIIIAFHVFLFINGIAYYKIEDYKQNYFLLSIFASSLVMGILFIVGNRELAFYLLNSRFLGFFIFYNLIIIQNTFFKDFITKRKRLLIIIMIALLFLGTFYSLRKLAWG